MGQPIVVREKPSVAHPGMVRFETNRALTGMGHERYRSRDDATGTRPPDELARRLFDRGGIEAVHVNGNIITVDLAKGGTSDGLAAIIEDLYLFYREPVAGAEDAPEDAGGDAASGAGQAEAVAAEPA